MVIAPPKIKPRVISGARTAPYDYDVHGQNS